MNTPLIRKLLLIEDNPGDARLISEYLAETWGTEHCRLLQARSLAEGIRLLDTEPVDLVLMDLGLPDSMGLQTFSEVRKRLPHVPMVILTGNDDEIQANDALQIGAEDYLCKQHIDRQSLSRALRHAALRHSREAQWRDDAGGPQAVALQLENERLQTVNRSLAHDLRAPLNGILGWTQLVQLEADQALPEQAQRSLRMVEETALEMSELINHLLAWSRDGAAPVVRERVDLSGVAQAMAERLEVSEPGRAVQWVIQPGLCARGNPALLANVLQNLLHNAWKYSRHARPARIELHARPDDTGTLVHAVIDNGVGFSPEDAARLFQPNQRASTAQAFEGHGLGLAGVKYIVERHGGRIWADSEPGVRTAFYFTL